MRRKAASSPVLLVMSLLMLFVRFFKAVFSRPQTGARFHHDSPANVAVEEGCAETNGGAVYHHSPAALDPIINRLLSLSQTV